MVSTAKLTYTGDMHCEAPMADGRQAMPVDSAVRRGQPGRGLSPMDLLALAHGTCTAMMMGKAAEANGLDISGMAVEVNLEMEGTPMMVTSVRARYFLPRRFSPADLATLEAGAKLCPVHTSLRPEIKVTLELVQPE